MAGWFRSTFARRAGDEPLPAAAPPTLSESSTLGRNGAYRSASAAA
jgi:hypothetical protein